MTATTTKVHVAAHRDARFIVGLSSDGAWQVHRVATWAQDEDGAETVCGYGAHRFFVAADWLPDMDDQSQVCEWCWKSPLERAAFYNWANPDFIDGRTCCVEV